MKDNSIVLGDFGLALLALDLNAEIQTSLEGALLYATIEVLNRVKMLVRNRAKSDVW